MFRTCQIGFFVTAALSIFIGKAIWAQDEGGKQESQALRAGAEEAADSSDVVHWNIVALQTTRAAAFNPLRETRALALVSAAIFDAVNSITRRYEPYAVRVPARNMDSTEAATHAAAHDVLVALYPDMKAALDAEYDARLAAVPNGTAKSNGIDTGRAVAAALVALRSFDHANDKSEYQPGASPGAWRPTPPASAAALEPGWGNVTPFFLAAGSQFRPGPPPALGSPTYNADLNEIASLGVQTNSRRTPAQTEAAQFWISTAPQLWNQAAQQLAVTRRLGASDTSYAFLLLNAAGADAMIAAWDSKYTYNQWRPVTAIRAQLPDPTWTPLINTPPFPDYIAGHTAYAGAAEAALEQLFGGRPGSFSLTSATANGARHTYESFKEVGDEVVNARVWGGVHWRTSSTAGRTIGNRVGRYALHHAPRHRGASRERFTN